MTDPNLTFFHAPNSRSANVMTLFEELGVQPTLHLLNLNAGDNRREPYLSVNPMGKVPAIRHGDAVITEQVAVTLYLADEFPDAQLAPPIGDPLRGPYVRWLAFYGASFEPAVIDRARKAPDFNASTLPYGDFDTMLKTVTDQLERGPYLLGERFSAADVLWGGGLAWTTGFGLVPKTPVIAAYVAAHNARPAVQRAAKRDAEIAAQQAADT